MMPTTATEWIISVVLLGAGGWGAKVAVSLLLGRLDKIVLELQALQVNRATQDQAISSLQDTVKDHEHRIREVERTQILEKL